MPYLTRSGWPVATLRWSFARRAASGTICSTPRRIRASCSSTLFTARFLLSKKGNHGIHGKKTEEGAKEEEEKGSEPRKGQSGRVFCVTRRVSTFPDCFSSSVFFPCIACI